MALRTQTGNVTFQRQRRRIAAREERSNAPHGHPGRDAEITDPFRVTKGKDFRLKNFDPGDTLGLKMDKAEAAELLQRGSDWLAMEQDILYAQESLVRAAGVPGDGRGGQGRHDQARHVGDQPAGMRRPLIQAARRRRSLRTTSCGATPPRLPQRGRIGIFNRSYYEEVLVVRVHKELLTAQKLPPKLVGEDASGMNGSTTSTIRELSDSQGDGDPQILPQPVPEGAEEALHGAARQAGEELEVLRLRRARAALLGRLHARVRGGHTGDGVEEHAPWYVVPADNKWFTRLVVAAAIVEAVEKLDLKYPKVTSEQKKDLDAARAELAAEK